MPGTAKNSFIATITKHTLQYSYKFYLNKFHALQSLKNLLHWCVRMFKEINLLLRRALSESMKVILWHTCASYKWGGEQKERKKHWYRTEKFLSDITLPVCYPGIFMKVMLALPSLTFQPHSWTQWSSSFTVFKSKDPDKNGLPCLFWTLYIWRLWDPAARWIFIWFPHLINYPSCSRCSCAPCIGDLSSALPKTL